MRQLLAIHAGYYQENASGITDCERHAKAIDASQAVLFCSSYEIEGEYLNVYQKLIGKPVFPIV